jgi:hypothetical protein
MGWPTFVVRALVIFAVLAAAAWSTEQWARPHEGNRVGGSSTRKGAPVAYRVHRADSSELGWSSTRFDRAALAANIGVFAIIALASAAHWSRAARSTEPGMPMRLPLGAVPLPPEATTRNEPRLRRLALHGLGSLLLTLAGALLGLGLVLGLVGWWYGEHLCSRYAMLGRRPDWRAMAARELGLPVALTSLLALLGVLLGWGVQ